MSLEVLIPGRVPLAIEVDAVRRKVCRQVAPLAAEHAGHVQQGRLLRPGHLPDGPVEGVDIFVVDVAAQLFLRRHRLVDGGQGLEVDHRVRLDFLHPPYQLRKALLVGGCGIAQLINADHDVHLGVLLEGQGLQDGVALTVYLHLAVLGVVYLKNRHPLVPEEVPGVQPAEELKALGAGVPQKHGVAKPVLIYRLPLFNRLPEAVGLRRGPGRGGGHGGRAWALGRLGGGGLLGLRLERRSALRRVRPPGGISRAAGKARKQQRSRSQPAQKTFHLSLSLFS